MKISVKKKGSQKPKSFPKVMVSTDGRELVLFKSPDCGTVLKSTGMYNVGHYITGWAPVCFRDFTGKITIKQ